MNVTLNSVYFVNTFIGFIAGNNGIILKTTNKGLNWLSMNSASEKNLHSVYFTDENKGYAVGDSIILKTVNGGISWTSQSLSYPMKCVFFINSHVGYIAAYSGTVIKTTNSGENWTASIALDPAANYTSIFFSDINTGYIVGLSGRYLKTTDAGIGWVQKPILYSKNFYCVQFPNKKTGYITGGWVTSMILKSVDEGETFTFLVDEFTGVRLFSSSFIDTNNGIAVGRQGYIVRTTDGGTNWKQETSGTNNILFGVQYLDNNTAYAVGDNGTIITTAEIIGVNQISSNIPANFSLEQNYPNPFNPSTRVRFAIMKSANVNIKLYNVLGEEVKTVVSRQMTPGIYETELNAADLPSGIYYYTMTASEFRETKKLILVK